MSRSIPARFAAFSRSSVLRAFRIRLWRVARIPVTGTSGAAGLSGETLPGFRCCSVYRFQFAKLSR